MAGEIAASSGHDGRAVQVLTDGFDRVAESVREVVTGLDDEQLSWRPLGTGNSITWLAWHLTRVQDDHLAGAAGDEQRWTADGWAERFALPLDRSATGYGHSSDEVDAVRVSSGDLLTGYHDAVHEQTVRQLGGWDDAAFDSLVDAAWDPPVTLAVRIVSVLDDAAKHVGQADYVRGLLRS